MELSNSNGKINNEKVNIKLKELETSLSDSCDNELECKIV